MSIKGIFKKFGKVKISANGFNNKLGLIMSLSTRILIFVSILILIIFLIKELFVPQTFTISEISVPSGFEKNGYSSKVIGNRISDRLTEIIETGSLSLENIENDILAEDEERSYQSSTDITSFDIQVGLFNVSVNEIISFLRKKLGNENKLMEGDLTEEETSLTLTLRLKSNDELVKNMRVRQHFNTQPNARFNALESLVERTSDYIVFYNDPVILLAYYNFINQEGLDSIFRRIIYDDFFDDQEKLWTYVIWGRSLYEEAEDLFYSADEADELYKQAMSKYEKVLEINPEFVTSRIGWDMASYYIEQEPVKAINIYKNILTYDTKNADANYFVAENLMRINNDNSAEAIKHYEKTIKHDPDGKGIQALIKVARIYTNMNEKDKAAEYYLKAIEHEKIDEFDIVEALEGYADLMFLNKHYNETIKALMKALKFKKSSEIYIKIAESYAHINDSVGFVNYLKMAVDDGYELNDSVLNSPLYQQYKNTELMRFLLEEY